MSPDPAVTRVKRLKPLYKYKLPDIHVKCTRCGLWCDSLIVAWVHSAQHGPFPETPNGTHEYFDDMATANMIAQNLRREQW